jgi:uncharacterized membrane protein YhaH (DUF805 family)
VPPKRADKEPDVKAYISTWSIAILSAACAWFGWFHNDTNTLLMSLAGLIAFLTFQMSPETTKISR